MKNLAIGFLSLAAVLAALLGTGRTTARAAEQPAANAGSNVAVIDISYIFEHHERFKQAIEAMKKDVEAFEMSLRQRGKEIETLREQMKAYKPGTPQYKQLEEAAIKKQAEGQAEAQSKRNEFLDREAKIYYTVYNEIVTAVEQFAQRHRIRLVIRFDSKPIDSQQRHEVLAAVNRGIVYQDRLNITMQILEMLNRANVSRAPAPAGATNQ